MEPDLPPNQSPPAAEEPPSVPEPSLDPADDPADGGDASPPPPPPGAEPGPASGEPGRWVPPFQFLRSRQERKLGGVAGGLAAAADLDPTLVRLAIVLGCLTGWGILAYLIAWAVIPEEDPALGRSLVPAPERTAKRLRIGLAVLAGLGVLHVVGAILGVVSSALIGLGLFPARLFGLSHRGFMPGEALLGLFLLVGGLLLVFRRHLPWAPAADTGSGAAWIPFGGASATPGAAPPGAASPIGDAPGAASGSGAGLGARATAAATAAARAARTNGPLLLLRAVGWLVALWFLAAAVIGGVFWATGALHVHLPLLPVVTSIAALGTLGFTLVRSRRVAAVVGAVALLLVPTALAAALTRVDGQAGHRSVTPVALADLERSYRHAAGVFELDLSRLPLPAGTTPVHISMGAGKIDVTVPWDAEIVASASVGAGTFELFGNRQTGVNLKGRTHSNGQPGGPVLDISGRAGAGEIVVERAAEPFTHQALRTGQPVPMQCDLSSTRTAVNGIIAGGPVRCSAADGVTLTPALSCVVADTGGALCRPVGEPEPAAGFANDPGTRHCQVPAGGGESTCSSPVPLTGTTSGGGSFTCSIPAGGGSSVCHPSGGGGATPAGPNSPAQPAAPAAPAAPTPPEPNSTAPPTTAPAPSGAAPGEYRCTVPEGGGPATCEPA